MLYVVLCVCICLYICISLYRDQHVLYEKSYGSKTIFIMNKLCVCVWRESEQKKEKAFFWKRADEKKNFNVRFAMRAWRERKGKNHWKSSAWVYVFFFSLLFSTNCCQTMIMLKIFWRWAKEKTNEKRKRKPRVGRTRTRKRKKEWNKKKKIYIHNNKIHNNCSQNTRMLTVLPKYFRLVMHYSFWLYAVVSVFVTEYRRTYNIPYKYTHTKRINTWTLNLGGMRMTLS